MGASFKFAVLKVFFTAALVALIGILYMDYLGYLDMGALYVHPTYLWGAIIGGAIMGVGFVAGGFCPGTSLCAVAIGKVDAIIYVIGIMMGVFIFSELYFLFQPIYDGAFEGNITLMDTFGVNRYWFVSYLIIRVFFLLILRHLRKKGVVQAS